jgi:hypothetical protein
MIQSERPSERTHIKVFVASTVYNFEHQLNDVFTFLDSMGYDVYMSHKGTIPLDSKKSNLENCLDAVRASDVFVGFVRPDYGSGVLTEGEKSIVHQEFETAFSREIPRFILADYRVVFTRMLCKEILLEERGKKRLLDPENLHFGKSRIMDSRSIQIYNDAIKDNVRPASRRKGNWVQEYVEMHTRIISKALSQRRLQETIW